MAKMLLFMNVWPFFGFLILFMNVFIKNAVVHERGSPDHRLDWNVHERVHGSAH
jgi:hypothetical protein